MARWRFGRGWPEKALRLYLEQLPHCPCNIYDAPEKMTPQNGWHFNSFEAVLGNEPPGPPLPDGLFERARAALVQYRFTDPRMVQAHFAPHVPLSERHTLAEMKECGFRFLNPVRVRQVWGGTHARRTCFGFEYATLEGHIERGFERFFVIKEHESGRARFWLEDHRAYGDFPNGWSRVGLTGLGPLGRRIWPRRAAWRLRRLAAGKRVR